MSDPLTQNEVEDVLSSIKRLVSENARAEIQETAEDAFVLTPEQRISKAARDAAGAEFVAPRKPVNDATRIAAEADEKPAAESVQNLEDFQDDIDAEIGFDADLLDTMPVIDEESLRELVVQTVREELRGQLGEKITRNVRKLVRREIQRALSELDV